MKRYSRNLVRRIPGRPLRRSLFAALAMLGASATTPVADPPPAPSARLALPRGAGSPATAFVTRVRFANRSSVRRLEWGIATVPFPVGVFTTGKSFGVRGVPSQIDPIGALWPDGSVRFAQISVQLDLGPGEERVIDVEEMAATSGQFQASSWVLAGLETFELAVVAVLPGGRMVMTRPTLHRMMVDGPIRRLHYLRGRIPGTDLVCDLWITVFTDQDHMPFELRVTSSSTGSEKWTQSVEELHLVTTGAFLNIRGAQRRGVTRGEMSASGTNHVRLLGPTTLFDGQGQDWWGEILFYDPAGTPSAVRSSTLLSAIRSPLIGVSTDWASSGAFGPFGFVPPPPPWILDGGRAAALSRRARFNSWSAVTGDPFDDWPLGLGRTPGQTGDQHDFGAAKLVATFASGMPDGVEEARLNAGEEAVRPVHFREADGQPVKASEHPGWVTWDGRPHYNTSISPDRLGKPVPQPYPQSQGWLGRDNQHWSSLTLAGAYLLTGSPSLLYELNNEAELYMSGHTLPSQKNGLSTNAIGASRAVGRTCLSMSWNYLCTERKDLARWVGKRLREVVVVRATGMLVSGPVRPITVAPPDPRQLMRTNWKPWEESQAVLGLEAVFQTMAVPEAHALAYMAAKTLIDHGWKITPEETIIATAIGWKEHGQPLTAAELLDPTWVLWSYGTNFDEWALSSVMLAQRYGRMYGDKALEQRATFIIGELGKRRSPPPGNDWDRYSEWEAVK